MAVLGNSAAPGLGQDTLTLQAANQWHQGSCSVIPIRADGTKRPAVEWKQYMTEPANIAELRRWFYSNPELGIGVVCGKVSGNLEMLELEGRAADSQSLDAIITACTERGVDTLFESFIYDGYAEWTPSGGLHFLYRISDHDVPGNTKVARRPATEDELTDNPQDRIKVLAETRGEGGYVVVAPTAGTVHPTGDAWTVTAGTIGLVPTISWEQRCALHEAFHAALDQMPAPPPPMAQRPSAASLLSPRGERPGDDFNQRTEWVEILQPHGWRVHHQTISETFWTRPGKNNSEGHSATTGLLGTGATDRLYVFSSSTPFTPEVPYTKFAAYTLLEHNNDFAAAARELGRRGFGTPRGTGVLPVSAANPYVAGTVATPELASPVQQATHQALASTSARDLKPWHQTTFHDDDFRRREHTAMGFGKTFGDVYHRKMRYVANQKHWKAWNGRCWEEDIRDSELPAMVALLEAGGRYRSSEDDQLAAVGKWMYRMQNMSVSTLTKWMKTDRRIIAAEQDFNNNRHLITCRNGVIDLGSVHFQDHHDPDMMLSKEIRVSYDKDADCPRWTKFLEQAVPDEGMRTYLQKAIGLTMLGDTSERALFLLHGESGTGKSQFIKVMELMFGDFAQTAQPSTFTEESKRATITNNLNDLRGRRFVSISELNEDEKLNEALVKRMTGGDTATTRRLYRENEQWRVEFMLWMATNYLPRLNSDDNAIWRRVKPIQFGQVVDVADEVKNLGEQLYAEEASGILNWMLEGVRLYKEHGLSDPEPVTTAVATYRRDVDTVAQFLDTKTEAGLLKVDTAETVPARTLHLMYQDWCRDNGIKWFGERRFKQRLLSQGFTQKRVESGMVWCGLGQRFTMGQWIVGGVVAGPNDG